MADHAGMITGPQAQSRAYPAACRDVPRDADAKTIKNAFRHLARRYQPDPSTKPDAERRSKEIAEAYGVLSDPAKRAEHGLKAVGEHRSLKAHQPRRKEVWPHARSHGRRRCGRCLRRSGARGRRGGETALPGAPPLTRLAACPLGHLVAGLLLQHARVEARSKGISYVLSESIILPVGLP
jgi:DnaJ domain